MQLIEDELYKDILKFLNTIANKTDNGYVWREACGLELELRKTSISVKEEKDG